MLGRIEHFFLFRFADSSIDVQLKAKTLMYYLLISIILLIPEFVTGVARGIGFTDYIYRAYLFFLVVSVLFVLRIGRYKITSYIILYGSHIPTLAFVYMNVNGGAISVMLFGIMIVLAALFTDIKTIVIVSASSIVVGVMFLNRISDASGAGVTQKATFIIGIAFMSLVTILILRIMQKAMADLIQRNSRTVELLESQKQIAGSVQTMINNLAAASGNLNENMNALSENSQDVASSVEEMTASIEELAASSESIAENSKGNAAETENLSKLVENIQNNARSISDQSSKGAEISNIADQKAREGEIVFNETIEKIENIQKSTQAISESASLIKDIADQVNLLSLNASIEAARAGEYGKGFSVVAEEISKLADNTQHNADSITKSIAGTLVDVNAGIQSIKTSSEKFTEIISYVKKTAVIVSQIDEEARSQSEISTTIKSRFQDIINMANTSLKATEEQATTHQEFIDTVSRISKAVQEMAQRAQSASDLTKSLDKMAEDLSSEMEALK